MKNSNDTPMLIKLTVLSYNGDTISSEMTPDFIEDLHDLFGISALDVVYAKMASKIESGLKQRESILNLNVITNPDGSIVLGEDHYEREDGYEIGY